jgi:hypothetical protein
MIRPSFVPPPAIRQLRDLARYRIDLVNVRTAEKNRVEKLLEDACIKLSVVASDIFGVSGRDMMSALISGERDPKTLAQLARSRMRSKITQLQEAFTGRFTDHHAFLLARMSAAFPDVPAPLSEQLRIGGRLVQLIGLGRDEQVVLFERTRMGCCAGRRWSWSGSSACMADTVLRRVEVNGSPLCDDLRRNQRGKCTVDPGSSRAS